MKTLKRILIGIYLCLIGLFFGLGCDTRDCCDPPPSDPFWYDTFVDEYYYIENINIEWPIENIQFVFIKKDHFLTYNESINKTKFEQTKKKYGDTHYDRELEVYKNNTAYCNEFIRFDVISDTDFDEAHPAGTSLGDITLISALSTYKYIKSGYTDEFDWNSDFPADFIYDGPSNSQELFDPGYHPVSKLLSELTPEDMLLLHSIWFKFIKEPTVKGTHRMTVILEDKEKEMTCQFDYIFE